MRLYVPLRERQTFTHKGNVFRPYQLPGLINGICRFHRHITFGILPNALDNGSAIAKNSLSLARGAYNTYNR